MTSDDFRELIKKRIGDIDGPNLTAGDVVEAAADACVEAMAKVRSDAIRDFARRAEVLPSNEASALPDDVRQFRVERLFARLRSESKR